MHIDDYRGSRKKIFKIGVWIGLVAVILSAAYFFYNKYWERRLKPPVGYSVEVNNRELKEAGTKWLESYVGQYRGKFVPRGQRIIEYSVDNMEIKEENVVQIDFSLMPKKVKEKIAYKWNGVINENQIKCQWVLWFSSETTPDGGFIYTVTKLQRPAAYDLEKYQTSGEKERDEYKQEYEAEIPHKELQYTYKIQDKVCFVSYDKGITWKELPLSLETLVSVGDGRPSYNKLQEKSYVVTPEKTAFVYGGTREEPLAVIWSEDMGNTWKTSEIGSKLTSTRVKFCSFPSVKVGYVMATGDRTMSQEGQIIYKTTDGGTTWKEVGYGPSTWLLQSGGFVDENLGFMSYPKIEGAETNFYRTEDGGKTFERIKLPVIKQEWMGSTFEPFVQPEIPYVEDGQLFLLIGQGPQGDFKGGRLMAKCKSGDRGKTWAFVELVEPSSEEIG